MAMAYMKAPKFAGKDLSLSVGRGNIKILDGKKYTDERLDVFVSHGMLIRVPMEEPAAVVQAEPVAPATAPAVETAPVIETAPVVEPVPVVETVPAIIETIPVEPAAVTTEVATDDVVTDVSESTDGSGEPASGDAVAPEASTDATAATADGVTRSPAAKVRAPRGASKKKD